MTESIHPSDWNFRFRSGRLCLDFIATMGDRDHLAFDRWRKTEDFARWCLEARLLGERITVSTGELSAARELREAMYRLVAKALDHETPDPVDIARLNEAARKPPLTPELTAFGQPSNWSSMAPYDAILATVARDAIDLLSSDALRRVRKCADAHCSVLFVDNSRPGQRRWCAMNGCGNKVKKAAYRKRQRVS